MFKYLIKKNKYSFIFAIIAIVSMGTCNAQDCWFRVFEHQCFEPQIDCNYTADIVPQAQYRVLNGWFWIKGKRGIQYQYTVTGSNCNVQYSICDAGDFTQGFHLEPVCRITVLDTIPECGLDQQFNSTEYVHHCTCDTTYRITYTPLPSYAVFDTLSTCNTVINPNTVDSLLTVNNCDSIIYTHTIQLEPSRDTVEFLGYQDEIFSDTLTNHLGCDSIVITIITATDIQELSTLIQEFPTIIDTNDDGPNTVPNNTTSSDYTPVDNTDSVEQIPEVTYPFSKATLSYYLPTAFSPFNQDGVNDEYIILSPHNSSSVFIDRVQIFERWGGRLVLSKNTLMTDESIGFNPTQPGVYVIIATINEIQYRETITVTL